MTARFRCVSGVAAAVSVLITTGCVAGGGPLNPLPDHGYGPVVVEPGKPFTDGFEVLSIAGDSPITIVDIRLIDSSPQVELVGVLMAGPDRAYGAVLQFEEVYPPVPSAELGPLVDAIGAELLPTSENPMGYELLFGLAVTEEGTFARGGYEVEYLAEGQRYLQRYVAEIVMCTSSQVGVDPACDSGSPEG